MFWIVFIASILLGSMLFFTIIVTPNIFSTLDTTSARKFIRKIFPKLYLWCIALNSILLIFLFKEFDFKFFLAGLSIFLFIISRQFLIPKINHYADLEISIGESERQDFSKSSNKKFKKLHSLSVILFSISFLCVAIILYLI